MKLLDKRVSEVKKYLLSVVILAAVAVGLASCAGDPTQTWNDAPVENTNTNGAVVGTMPDGFSNFARKCDGPNMVYVIYHSTSAYGSIDVVPNDPRCSNG